MISQTVTVERIEEETYEQTEYAVYEAMNLMNELRNEGMLD